VFRPDTVNFRPFQYVLTRVNELLGRRSLLNLAARERPSSADVLVARSFPTIYHQMVFSGKTYPDGGR